MSNLNERQLLVLTIAVAVVLTGTLLYFVFDDRGEIDSIEQDISGLDARIDAAMVESRKIPALEDKVLLFRAVEPMELGVLPTEQHIADFHRNLSSWLNACGLKFQELPESSPEDSELAKGIKVTRNRIKGRGDAASILKFMNMIENDPRLVSIKGFKIQAGDQDRDHPDQPVLHDFELHLETYFYRPGKTVIDREHIPGAEERLQSPAMRASIAAFQPERPDTYVLRPAVGRRDPLVDPRRTRETVDPEAQRKQFEKEESIVVELETGYREIQELLEKEKALERAGDLFRLDRIRSEIDEKINNLRARVEQVGVTKSVSIAELQARMDVIAESLGRLRSTRAPKEIVVTRQVAEKTLEELQGYFTKGDYSQIDTLGQSWVSFLRGKQVMPEARPVIEQIRVLRDRAKVLGEFAAMQFDIGGRIVDREDPQRSVVGINGKSCRPGNTVDEKGLVTLVRIEKDAVTFEYKGEKIRRAVGEKTGKDDPRAKRAAKRHERRPARRPARRR